MNSLALCWTLSLETFSKKFFEALLKLRPTLLQRINPIRRSHQKWVGLKWDVWGHVLSLEEVIR